MKAMSRRTAAILMLAGAFVLLAGTIGWRVSVAHVRDAVMRSDPDSLLSDTGLRGRVIADGKPLFARSCAGCHGADGAGSRDTGVPDLRDAETLHGTGLISEIEQIVLHGIRSGDSRGRNLADMPAYARAVPYPRDKIEPLKPGEIEDLATFLSAAQGRAEDGVAVARGKALYKEKACWDCHTNDAGGDPAIGAPNLVDRIWLYGDGSKAAIRRSIAGGRAGFSPAFNKHLTPYEARAVSAYAASLAQPSGTTP
jgi:cytochrome c oxidase cbb3-type subunit 3